MAGYPHAIAYEQHMDHVQKLHHIMSALTARPLVPRSESGAFLGRLACVALTMLCVGYIDISTGYEVSVFLLYTIPVALATRLIGPVAGSISAVVASGVWVWADVASGHTYSRDWILYINAANRLAYFLLTVAAIRFLQGRYRALRRQIEAFSGEIPMCSQCHRIGGHDGYWRSPEDHLTEFGGADIHHKACPDCARRSYARAGYRHVSEQAN